MYVCFLQLKNIVNNKKKDAAGSIVMKFIMEKHLNQIYK